MVTQKLKTHQTQKPNQSQAPTHQHPQCQVNQANQVNLQVNCRSPPALAQMTQRQIQILSSDDTQSITSQTSTASERTLRPRIPFSYNETLLQCLHGRPQIRTLNNLSIPLPDSSEEDTEDTDELTQQETCKDTDTMSK